ncbi:ABC transporter permease [Streptomyces brevispora]|uniref:ABC transporter permease n=1 Tax=Streptomyces brevispora TaxID=887462 RepID=UPI003713B058
MSALTRRNLLQIKADPDSLFDILLMPVIYTVLFVYVFGGAVAGSQEEYVQYVMPGLMSMIAVNIAMTVGIGINSDFKTGVMDRFRTLPIEAGARLLGPAASGGLPAKRGTALELDCVDAVFTREQHVAGVAGDEDVAETRHRLEGLAQRGHTDGELVAGGLPRHTASARVSTETTRSGASRSIDMRVRCLAP